MKTLDLFSGIGGFSLAARRVWGADHRIHSFIEIDPFCQKVLKKHWPCVPIHDDIRTYKHDGTTIDLLHAGCPCQPASCAGKQRGTSDDRWLWQEAFRVVREANPTWCIFENVKGLLTLERGVVFENLLLELEALGYETETFIVPACAVGAPHRRDRVWIVANASSGRFSRQNERENQQPGRAEVERADCDAQNAVSFGFNTRSSSASGQESGAVFTCESDRHVADSKSLRWGEGNSDGGRFPERMGAEKERQRFANDIGDASNPGDEGSQRRRELGEQEKRWEPSEKIRQNPTGCYRNKAWDEPWPEAALRTCVRPLDDGLSSRLAQPKGWRVNAIKAVGNAIVPSVVMPIMQAIKDIMEIKENG